MKKANLINFIIIAIIFILFYIIHFYFIQNNIDIYHRGLRLVCSQKGYTIITSGGKKIDIKPKIFQIIKIPS